MNTSPHFSSAEMEGDTEDTSLRNTPTEIFAFQGKKKKRKKK
jgi:hypothetical protein